MNNQNPAAFDTNERGALGTAFDRAMRSLLSIPDAVATKTSTLRHIDPITEQAQTFIVQTFRHRDLGDTIFIEYVGTEGSIRMHLPPVVTQCIARQYDALSGKTRSKAAKAEAARRKAAGVIPGFLKGKKAKAKS